jgi:hypothetical protein
MSVLMISKRRRAIEEPQHEAQRPTLDAEHQARVAQIAGKPEEELRYLGQSAHVLFHYFESLDRGTNLPGAAAPDKGIARILRTQRPPEPPRGEPPPPAASVFGNMSRGELLRVFREIQLGGSQRDPGEPAERPDKWRCRHCGFSPMSLLPSEGIAVCAECDSVERRLVDAEGGAREPGKESSIFSYCYKRQNHFQEWISQTQGREHTLIADNIYDSITSELRRQKITDMSSLTTRKVREVMKKLHLNKYYEHVPHIINRLSGQQTAFIQPELESRLKAMFSAIQKPFMMHAPAQRRNFLSYSFVLHKFIQLLGRDDLLHLFPLLKSREKLAQQDCIWREICASLDWQFIPST